MSIEKTIRKIQAIREGGNTERAHTIPHHGSYSVAEHSWHVATLLAILHPNPSRDLILAGMWHDVHERWTGDLPSPIMRGIGRDLLVMVKKVAGIIETGLEIDTVLNLSKEDYIWLKACDMLEFWLWSIDQEALGNRNAKEGQVNAEHWFDTHRSEVPNIFLDLLFHYDWCRTSDKDGWKL